MANESPPTIDFGIGQGYRRTMKLQADGSYADVYAPAYGAGIVTDNTGKFTFDIVSLGSKIKYDTDGNQLSITYGPDLQGRRIMQTSVYQNGLMVEDSNWQLVDENNIPVNANGDPL